MKPFHSGPRGITSGPASRATPPGWSTLFTPSGRDQLTEVERELASGVDAFELGARLRAQGVPPDDAAALLSQADLRRKAALKFGRAAGRYLYTPAGLEQATRSIVADTHAQRFAAAGCRVVADLGCGIGAESLALMAAGREVRAVEIDPFTAQIADYNLSIASGSSESVPPRVSVGDAEAMSFAGIDGVFLDPARRTAGHRDTRRLSSPADYSPSLEFAFGLADRLPTGVKLGPGFDRELIPEAAEAQWISVDGQVVETGLWFGSVARPGVGRAALVVRGDAKHEMTAAVDHLDADTRELGSYLYEPDGAVIRARLIGLLAEQLNAGMVSDAIAYLTADSLVQTPFAQAFRVIEELPGQEKQLRRALSERGIGSLEIKKRGADVDPAALRSRLKLRGPNRATLILTRAQGRHITLLAERCAMPPTFGNPD
ncbi:THUMP-like domain-containing protein [Leucobacter sp. W1478]|uniref:class I SAM-dependent methyltransferase n=1 Tax=Leucobacter sp. W1478 TaxID=3439065 RepID=UPI003F368812